MSRKKAIFSECDEKLAPTPRNSTSNETRPRRHAREHLPTSVLEELWSIWRADPRVPSIKSRRSWAISRNANPRLVDCWFCRRRTCAKKAGQPISDESYDLPLDSPIVPKRGQSTTPIEPELETVFDLPSDDTLVLVYPPDDNDLNDIESSSDTIFEDASGEPKRTETPAYKEVLQPPCLEDHQRSQPEPKPSSADLDAAEDRCDEDVSFEDSTFPTCNRGQGKKSNFTCILCSTKSVQGTPDEVLADSDAISDSRRNLFVPCPRIDFFPDTLSELSAIPFLFRTPRAVLPDNADNHRTADNWSIIEDELGRLVNDGKLDFSFLDVPHLASMELLD